jgi:hypothetical protein
MPLAWIRHLFCGKSPESKRKSLLFLTPPPDFLPRTLRLIKGTGNPGKKIGDRVIASVRTDAYSHRKRKDVTFFHIIDRIAA